MFSKSCPLDVAARLWDACAAYGDYMVIRAAVGMYIALPFAYGC